MSSEESYRFVEATAIVSDEEIRFSVGGMQRLNWWNNRNLPDKIDLDNLRKVEKTREGVGGKLNLKTEDYNYKVAFRDNKFVSLLGYQGEDGALELIETLTSDYEHIEEESAQNIDLEESSRVEPPVGKSVTKERIDKFEEILDKGEKVHYIVKEVAILFGNWYAFTDKRMIFKQHKFVGTEDSTIPYKNILSINLSTSLIQRNLSVSTKAGEYNPAIAKGNTGKEELRNLVEYVNGKASKENAEEEETSKSNEENSENPKEKLEDIKELHDKGILSDEEFENKKKEILDEF